MSSFGNIYLCWRKGSGSKRHIVGIIKYQNGRGVSFQYLSKEKITEAISDGFTTYTEFSDLEKVYTENVLEVFKQRLFRSERSDYKQFLDFWGIDEVHKEDTLYILAYTQGLVPTDNFEFLADFNLTKKLKFVSEIAGLTHTKVPSDILSIGDEIEWKICTTEHDKYQVNLYTKDHFYLGCVKKIHSKVFHDKRAQGLKIIVKSIDKNGILKRVFIEISQKEIKN